MAKRTTANMDETAQFAANIDRLFKTPTDPKDLSRGLNIIGNVRELERSPNARKVYLTLVTMAIKAKSEGYTDKQGNHKEGSGAVMHFALSEALEGVDLQGSKPLDICDELIAARLIRGGRVGPKRYRIWFVADLLDAPQAKAKAPAETSAIVGTVDYLSNLFALKK
jgi:hypothetical protein